MKKVIYFSTIVFFYFICISIYRVDAATFTASACSKAAVESALSSAKTGDVVVIPSGTCSWPAAVTLNKGLTIKGQTTTVRNATTYSVTPTDSTIIQKYGFTVTATTGVRITGITFDGNVTGAAQYPISLPTSPVGMRIDHNHFTHYVRTWNKGGGGGYLNVLFDHNRITQPGQESLYIVGAGNTSWSAGGTCGSSDPEKTTWLENNEWILETANCSNPVDMGEGARVVFRGNKFTATENYIFQELIETHGHCWGQRDGNQNAGSYCLEISNNKVDQPKDINSGALLLKSRGGKAYVYNNIITGPHAPANINFWTQEVLTNCNTTACAVQAHEDLGYHAVPLESPQYSSGLCTQYPCPMQTNGSYVFGNDFNGGIISASIRNAGEADYCQLNRDWWDDVNGRLTKGIHANRPGTCTAQNTYWETDNKKLYKCTATNVWSLVYEAYVYPHPLTKSYKPYPPRNLKIGQP